MDGHPPEQLTAEELRNRLFHSLRNRGLVDSIKSQLRNSLVTELQQSVQGPLTLKDLKVPEEGSLLHRASNNLVSNHLKACEYEYTLSVFLPECGLNQDKKFETNDLLKLLNISPHSRLYERLKAHSQQNSKKGFLWQLLSEVSALHANSINNVGCQTDLIRVGPITPLDEKLSDVDEFYGSKREDFLRTGKAGAEERLLSFQRQLEDRYNTQLKLELARMRDAEIASIKMEEKENNRKELEQTRRELDRVYKERHDALVLRERNTLERLQQQTEIQERETYAQRQSILEEIEAVRQREIEVKREAEVNKREKKLAENRVKDKESDIRRRELEVKQRETSFEQRLQNEMAQFKLDQQARFIERIQNVEVREATVKEVERVVTEEKARLQQIKDDLRDKTHRVNELETFLSEAKHKEINATKNNEYLNAKLRDMSDHSTLKEQVILYRNELETVRTRLAEVLSTNERERGRQEELLRELRRPSPESLMLHRDLERAKENLRQEQAMFNQQKQMLEARLKEELDRNKDLVQRFEEQTLQMRDMNREVVDLRQHLHMTNKALSNEVFGKSKDPQQRPGLNDSKRSAGIAYGLEGDTQQQQQQQHHRFEPDLKDVYHDVDFENRSPSYSRLGGMVEDESSSIDSSDVIAQAKYRLRNLDKEAHNLEQAYSDFHHRITNVEALPLVPPPAQSPIRGRGQGQAQRMDESPRQSPIPFDNPMSSTPHKHPVRKPQDFNDSFSELGTQSKRQGVQMQLRLSPTPADDRPGIGKSVEDKRHVKMGTITVDDLERRPGSPPIMVVADSASSSGHTGSPHVPITSSSSTAMRGTHQEPPLAPIQAPSALTASDGFTLDNAWKRQLEEEQRAEREAARRQREMEEELQRQEETQRENERRAREQEKQKEEERRLEEEKASAAAKAQEEDDKIDPVMKQYMAMVQQQKEKEKEVAKKTVDVWSRGASVEKTPSHSEQDELSAAVDDKSEQDDDGFSW